QAGVLNSPFIKLTIFFKPFTDETVNTQALSCNLYLIKPDPINSSNFLAKGSFFIPNVIQNLGLCLFFFLLCFSIQICPSPSNSPAKYSLFFSNSSLAQLPSTHSGRWGSLKFLL